MPWGSLTCPVAPHHHLAMTDGLLTNPRRQSGGHGVGVGANAEGQGQSSTTHWKTFQNKLSLFSLAEPPESNYFQKKHTVLLRIPVLVGFWKTTAKENYVPDICIFWLWSELRGHAPQFSSSSFRSWQTLTSQWRSSPLGLQPTIRVCAKRERLAGASQSQSCIPPSLFSSPFDLWGSSFLQGVNYSCLYIDIKLALPGLPAGWGR